MQVPWATPHPNGTLLGILAVLLSNLSLYKGQPPCPNPGNFGQSLVSLPRRHADVVPEDFTMVDATENGYTMKFEDYDFYKAYLTSKGTPF